jgi:hypothetical protein
MTLAALVFVGIPWASTQFDTWLGGTQQAVIDSQIEQENEETLAAYQAGQARELARTESACEEAIQQPRCAEPSSFEELESCLWALRTQRCDDLPGVHLCAAVEEIRHCRRPANASIEAGCAKLREAADCANRPAGERPTHNWSINTPT